MNIKKNRSGFTTGACAAAAAKAATLLLLSARDRKIGRSGGTGRGKGRDFSTSALPRYCAGEVEIPFPDGSRVVFEIHDSGFNFSDNTAYASVVKDAGDDPDVTNGMEIVAEARLVQKSKSSDEQTCKSPKVEGNGSAEVIIKGGKGVGIVTKPGLVVPVGEPAINPVPRKMIQDAVSEALAIIPQSSRRAMASLPLYGASDLCAEITILVTDGESVAKKTLNERLGIMGGLSILGTTGIVRPVSAEAWTATITASLDVAKAAGRDEIVLSAGRTSEKAHMNRYGFPEESYVMMGDYLEFSLREASSRSFARIHLCAQWAKMLKIAMATPQTHVRHGAIDVEKTIDFLNVIGVKIPKDKSFNTAREIFDYLLSSSADPHETLIKVCNAAKAYAADIADPANLSALLVAYDGEIIATSDARSM